MRTRRRLLALVLAGLAACGGDADPGTPAASEPAGITDPERTSTTKPLTPEEEVEAAYLRSWEVLSVALRDLDAGALPAAFAGPALEVFSEEVERLAADNTAVRLEVEHNISRIEIHENLARVYDTYRNHSVLIDPASGEPVEPDPDSLVSEMQTLQQIEGQWKVVEVKKL